MLDLLHGDDRAAALSMVTDALAARRGWTDMELRWRHATGRVVTLQGSSCPVLDRPDG